MQVTFLADQQGLLISSKASPCSPVSCKWWLLHCPFGKIPLMDPWGYLTRLSIEVAKGTETPVNLPSKSACPAEHSSERRRQCASQTCSAAQARAQAQLLGLSKPFLGFSVRAWSALELGTSSASINVFSRRPSGSILSSSVWHTTCHKQVCKGLHWLRVRDVLVPVLQWGLTASQARMVRPASRSKPDMQQQVAMTSDTLGPMPRP